MNLAKELRRLGPFATAVETAGLNPSQPAPNTGTSKAKSKWISASTKLMISCRISSPCTWLTSI